MPSRTIFIFECDDGRYFALSRAPHCLGRLQEQFGDLNWRLRRRLSANEMGAAYVEAALLLKSRPLCLLKLQSDGRLNAPAVSPRRLATIVKIQTKPPFTD